MANDIYESLYKSFRGADGKAKSSHQARMDVNKAIIKYWINFGVGYRPLDGSYSYDDIINDKFLASLDSCIDGSFDDRDLAVVNLSCPHKFWETFNLNYIFS